MAEANRERLHKLLGWFRSGMLATRTRDGMLRARPVAVARIDDNGDIFLATNLSSERRHELWSDHQIAVTFQFAMACVTVSGPARVITDRAVIVAAWNEAMRAWFPGGADDPSLCLIQLRAVTGEYWDMRGMKKVRTLYESSRAYANAVTCSPAETSAWSLPRAH